MPNRLLALLAAALALGTAGSALAQAGSRTIAVTVANTQTDQFVASAGHAAGPGETNLARAFSQGDFTTDSVVDANVQFHGGSQGLSVGHSSDLQTDHHQGMISLSALASASATDRLTISGLPADDDRAVIFHTGLETFDGLSGVPGFTLFSDPRTEDFRAVGDATLHIISEGIGPSALGTDVYAERTVTAERGHDGFSTLSLPTFIDFNLAFNLGQARSFGVTLLDVINMSIDDRNGSLDGRLLSQSGYSVAWDGFVSVTDAVTGEELCGLTLSSEAGVNYGSVRACPGGGGDGGNGGGGTALPEPAAWALMIAGFGAAGGALRRRKPRVVG